MKFQKYFVFDIKNVSKINIFLSSLFLLILVIFGYNMTKNIVAVESIRWMNVYPLSYFRYISLKELFQFFYELKIPIPPIIGFFEILSLRLGSSGIIIKYAYRISIVGTYCGVLLYSRTTINRMFLSFILSGYFLYATTLIHPMNSQGYDIYFPAFFMIYILLQKATSSNLSKRMRTWILPGLSGFFLSMTELSRPFLVFILPLFIIFSYLNFQESIRKQQLIVFLTPIILLSGLWHAHLFITHKQITFSNHSGYNLIRAWPLDNLPDLEIEVNNTPIKNGSQNQQNYKDKTWENLNTVEHSENSKRLQKAVIEYWLTYPGKSTLYTLERVDDLLSAKTKLYKNEADSEWLGGYKLLVKITSSLMILNVGFLISYFLNNFSMKSMTFILKNSDNVIIIFTIFNIVVLAVGEQWEEARIILSILPFLATLPLFRKPMKKVKKHEREINW